MSEPLLLVYDRGCPACHLYCQLVQVRRTVGELELIDACSADHPVLDEITAAGLDIDQGMVLKLNGKLYYGSDTIHMLSLLGSRSGIFNRLNYLMFRNARLAGWLYPMLRSLRNLLLKLLRRKRINNLGDDADPFF